MGQSEEALAYHWRQAGENEQAVDAPASRPPTRRDAAGRRSTRSALYTQALELVPEGDTEQRRSIRLRQAVTAQALTHIMQADVDLPKN